MSDEITANYAEQIQALQVIKRHMDYCRSILKTPADEVLSESIIQLTAENADLRSKLARYESVCGQDLVAECAELRAKMEMQERDDFIKMEMQKQERDDFIDDEREQFENERADLRARLEQAEAKCASQERALNNVANFACPELEAKCAEMRSVLQENLKCHIGDWGCPACKTRIEKILASTPCGTGWSSPEDYAALEARIGSLIDAIGSLKDFVDGKRNDSENISKIINGALGL